MSPWSIKRLMEQEKNFSESSLRDGIFKCHQADLAIKRGRGRKDLIIEKLVIDLCRPSNAPLPTVGRRALEKGEKRGSHS
jgi:DNA polymerase III delta subunit